MVRGDMCLTLDMQVSFPKPPTSLLSTNCVRMGEMSQNSTSRGRATGSGQGQRETQPSPGRSLLTCYPIPCTYTHMYRCTLITKGTWQVVCTHSPVHSTLKVILPCCFGLSPRRTPLSDVHVVNFLPMCSFPGAVF